MASNPPSSSLKKRGWGRSMQREKINIVENMELETSDKVNAGDSKTELAHISAKTSVDLQHPEFLTTAKLVNLLKERKVPIPVYEDGSTSRDRLLFLFRQHVVPRPQRNGRKKRHYKDEIYHQNEDTCNESRLWEGGGSGSMLGKRKSKNDEKTVSKKRPVTPIAGTLSTTPTAAQNCTIRKLKRPKQSEIEIECKMKRNNNEL